MVRINKWPILALSIFALLTGCQQFDPPENVEFEPVSLMFEDISDYAGEYIKFVATIEFAYYTDCDAEVDGFDACPLYLKDSPHMINVVLGSSKNSINTSGNIIFSDGTRIEADVFGRIRAVFMGKVRECDQEKSCLIDIYQIDPFKENWDE
jgi:hypothetical protein